MLNGRVEVLVKNSEDRYLEELGQFLEIPSVSADPDRAADVSRCASWLANHLRGVGLEHVQVIPTAGHPIVYADWLHADGAPTVLLYGHYDVQPADPLELWTTAPFQPSIRDGAVFARGATDDKGQCFVHLKAMEAHFLSTGRLPLNMRVLFEGEEEIGSPSLGGFLDGHRQELECDAVLISDSAMLARNMPSITYALRGLAYFQIDLRGSAMDLHSGSFGGAVANPGNVIAEILSKLKAPSGWVAIPGFYDDVVELTPHERAEFAKLPFDELEYRETIGVPVLSGESGFSTLERTWGRPCLDVNGILAGFTGQGSKTVIPATAMAKVSMRLVPNQDPERIATLFQSYLEDITPPSVRLRVTAMHGGLPWRTDPDGPFIQAAARAFEHGFRRTPLFTREGASIPIVATFQSQLDVPIVLFGLGLPDENAHAPNEHFDLGNLFAGIVCAATFYEEAGAIVARH